jgi:hypothetical protein
MDKPAAPRKPSKVSSESYDAAFLKRNEIKTRQYNPQNEMFAERKTK